MTVDCWIFQACVTPEVSSVSSGRRHGGVVLASSVMSDDSATSGSTAVTLSFSLLSLTIWPHYAIT